MTRLERSLVDLEAIATRLRKAGRIEGVKSFHVLDFFEQLKATFPGLKLVSVADESLPGADAEANAATNTILIRQSTLEAAVNWEPRARFILLEEVCHIALGHTGPRHRNRKGRPTGFTPTERETKLKLENWLPSYLCLPNL